MNKKQVVALSLLPGLLGCALMVKLGLSAMTHQSGVFGGLLISVFWGTAAVLGLVLTAFPVFLLFLYPKDGFSAVAESAGAALGAPLAAPGDAPATDEDEEFEDDFGDPAAEDDGEQLFDDGEFEDDFEDEFDGDFEDDDEF